jgi:hypothetical protein
MMFKRKKKFEQYSMKPVRIKPWHEKAWIGVMLFVGMVGSLLAWMGEMADGVIDCAAYTSDDISHHHDDSDWFEFDSGTHSDMFSHDDDDITRGMWDVTSTYYPMFHTDD